MSTCVHFNRVFSVVQEICSTSEYKEAIDGHTPHFVSDRLTMLIGTWGVLSPRDSLIWLQLMVQSRKYKTFEIRISHKQLHKDAGVSEATMRDALSRMSAQGFIKILRKNITQFGKDYTLQVGIPKHLLPELKSDLNRCRSRNPYHASEETVYNRAAFKNMEHRKQTGTEAEKTVENTKAKPADNFIHSDMAEPASTIASTAQSDMPPAFLQADAAEETVYLSLTEKVLTRQEAYLSDTEKPILKAPYQPLQHKSKNWTPSAAELALIGAPNAKAPQNKADQNHVFDVAEWMAQLKFTFQQNRFKASGCTDSFGRFLLKSKDLDTQFSKHLESLLPDKAKPWLPILLQRLSDYQSHCPNAWFPVTEGMMKQQNKDYQLALEKQAAEKPKPSLSPQVAVAIPRHWYNRVLMTAKTLRLPKRQVPELAYHIENYSPNKHFDTFEGKRKFNLCLAIRLIKARRWGCPKGLEIKQQQNMRSSK